jgi:hypothetical protein
VDRQHTAAAPAPSALRTSRRVDFQPYIDTSAAPANPANTATAAGVLVYNRLFSERFDDFSAPLTPTNVTLERIEPPAEAAATDTSGDPVRLSGSNAPPDIVKGNNMVIVVTPQPLTWDERVNVGSFVLNHGPIAVVELLLERARATRNMLRTHQHLPADATSAALLNQAEQCVLHCKRKLAVATTLDPAHEATLSNIVSDTKLQRAAETLESNILPELHNEIRDRTRNICDTAKHRATNPHVLAPSTTVHDPAISNFTATSAIHAIGPEFGDVLNTVLALLQTRINDYIDPPTRSAFQNFGST